MRIVLEDWDKGISVGGRKMSNMRYADDTTLLAQTKEDIEILLARLEVTSAEFGLTINRDKTKMMIVDRANQNRLEIESIANCEVVQTYIYLGSTVSNTGGCDLEIRRRCAITRQLWWNDFDTLPTAKSGEDSRGKPCKPMMPNAMKFISAATTKSPLCQECTTKKKKNLKRQKCVPRIVLCPCEG
ncbi:jg1438 [Pararge aegeria aegeria]|uniref:Jg1438 protein n=1 Tax=Pararge aegeria aegeria TaxID=348720 RepID=A0A8S4QET8_9NEOP|nr:jg1438 [Pararge aegeria aegeria]